MKNRIVFGALLILFLIELIVLMQFAFPNTTNLQDTVAVNEAVKTVQKDWNAFEKHRNHTSLEYVVLDNNGAIRHRTKAGLSENINAAIRHKDTILDIEIEGLTVGKIILYNNDTLIFQSEKLRAVFAFLVTMLIQGCICVGYFFHIRRVILKPFDQMKDFAKRIAGGNLDIPLEMDRQNLFGAFTESFDLMRSELKKAQMAEAKAKESKKELVAKLSHDIKTPIASMKAAAEVGAALSFEEKHKENYWQIMQKADQINTLITDLFTATLKELHELSVTPSDFYSQELQNLLENADYLHRAVIPPVPACLLYADRLRLQQVFDNIFANSYKYANTKIQVSIYATDNYLTVCVEDYGGGIDAAELPLLKEKFRRGSNAKNIEGAGLGLYIADYCMHQMQGRLNVENGSAGLRVMIQIAFCNIH